MSEPSYYERKYPQLGPALHDELPPVAGWQQALLPFFPARCVPVVRFPDFSLEADDSKTMRLDVQDAQPLEPTFQRVQGPSIGVDKDGQVLWAMIELDRPWGASQDGAAPHPIHRTAEFASKWVEKTIPPDARPQGTSTSDDAVPEARRTTVNLNDGNVRIKDEVEAWRRSRLLQISFSLIVEALDPACWSLSLAKIHLATRHNALYGACRFTRFLINSRMAFINHHSHVTTDEPPPVNCVSQVVNLRSLKSHPSHPSFLGIVASGTYTGGELVLPPLRLTMQHTPNLILICRASLRPYIRPATGQRRSIILCDGLQYFKNLAFEPIPGTSQFQARVEPGQDVRIGHAWREYDKDDPDAAPPGLAVRSDGRHYDQHDVGDDELDIPFAG